MADGTSWTRRDRRLLLDCAPWFRVFADDVTLPDGRQVDGYLRIDSREFAMVFALTEDGRVPFVRTYKYGLGREDLQLPAGYLEAGEAPQACASRELLEETGCAAGHWEALGSFVLDGNRGYGRGHFFLARQAQPVRPPDAGDLEAVQVELLPLTSVTHRLAAGAMAQMPTIACAALALTRVKDS